MSFLGGLFEKKVCAICGEEIGLLGNRKLADGNMCKKCAAKLSPWFSERKTSTVEEITRQLAYREANKEDVERFHISRTLGKNTKVLIDDASGRFMVTSASNLKEANPDVMKISDVTGCDIDISENRDEDMMEVKDKEGKTKRVSYTPPHYHYFYDFYLNLYVNNPYFDHIRFKLNSSEIEVTALATVNQAKFRGMTEAELRMTEPEYVSCNQLAEEIKAALTGTVVQAAAAPASKVICPNCGAATTPDANGCCEYCGTPIPKV